MVSLSITYYRFPYLNTYEYTDCQTASWRWFIVRMISEASECLDGHRQIVINLIDRIFLVAGAVKLMYLSACEWRLRMTYMCMYIYVVEIDE